LTDCGSESESCCTSDEVPASTYYRTYANSGSGATGEADPATISGFRLDKYLVTVGRFRQFVAAVLPAGNAAGWLPAAGSGKHTYLNGGNGLLVGASADAGVSYETGWVASDDTSIAPTDANLDCDIAGTFMSSPVVESTWTPAAGDNENLPINCINWQEAYAFCIWDGGFLPSEAEWESAAADGSEQRGYPWGSADPGMANRYAIYANYYPAGGAANMDNIAPVGTATLGAGKYGQLDLAGNVWEWALDQYRDSYVDPCTDCAFLPVGSSADAPRIDRGGDFGSDSSQLIASYRNSVPSIARDVFVGVRCARAP
jgi:sulfatase modifying factor 1